VSAVPPTYSKIGVGSESRACAGAGDSKTARRLGGRTGRTARPRSRVVDCWPWSVAAHRCHSLGSSKTPGNSIALGCLLQQAGSARQRQPEQQALRPAVANQHGQRDGKPHAQAIETIEQSADKAVARPRAQTSYQAGRGLPLQPIKWVTRQRHERGDNEVLGLRRKDGMMHLVSLAERSRSERTRSGLHGVCAATAFVVSTLVSPESERHGGVGGASDNATAAVVTYSNCESVV
jgi:hypothetical protein